MREIPIHSRKWPGLKAQVDDEDYAYLSRFRWHVKMSGRVFYAWRHDYFRKTTVLMHREIMQPADGVEIDHRDFNGTNNQRYNLREATRSQQVAHSRKYLVAVSSYKGVSWSKSNRSWQAQIGCEGRNIHLGFYVTQIEAAYIYDAEARELRGEFAEVNFE